MSDFWQKLTKPFMVLAPMDDVTDNVFRKVINDTMRPDVFFTEFTNADGLTSPGSKIVGRKLKYESNQHPIVAQIWGNNPDTIFKASAIVRSLGFDAIDFNMSCPVRNIVGRNCGAALIGNLELAKSIIEAVRTGSGGMPISVKTRLGLKTNVAAEWCEFLLNQNLDALTIHARTAAEMSKVPAHWDEIGKVVKIRDLVSPKTMIIGNGDIKSYEEAKEAVKKYNVDGVMIGRGIFDNPWIFDKENTLHTKTDYINLLLKHLDLYEKENTDPVTLSKRYPSLKKFFKMYIKAFNGANVLRQRLMNTDTLREAREILINDNFV